MQRLPPPTPFHWREALANLPVMLILLLVGSALGHAAQGAMAAGAALTVGCAAGLTASRARLLTMACATLVITAATFAGLWLAPHGAAFALGVIAASVVCAAAFVVAPRAWWMLQQAAIFYLLTGFHPAWSHDYAEPLWAVLIGGSVQLLCSALAAWAIPGAPAEVPAATLPNDQAWQPALTYAAYTLFAVGICLALIRVLPLQHGYWAPMTALLLLRPGWQQTRHRAIERLAGTLAGALVATLVAFCTGEAHVVLLFSAVLWSSLAIGLQKAPYGYLSTAFTASTVFLLSLSGVSVVDNGIDRFLATLLGGLVVVMLELTVHLLLSWRHLKPTH